MNPETQLSAMLCKYFPQFDSWFDNLSDSATEGLLERWACNLSDTTQAEVSGFVRWLVQGRIEIGNAYDFDRLAKRCREAVLSVRPREMRRNDLGVITLETMDAQSIRSDAARINQRRNEIASQLARIAE